MAAIESVIVAVFRHVTHASHTEQFIVRARSAVSDSYLFRSSQSRAAILPAHQGQGIDSQLVGQAFTQLHNLGASGCVVLGDPAYYARFGFKAEPSLVLPAVPPQYFQAIAFVDSVPSGTVSYHEAFASKG
jgi:putative acetyltransferase